MVLHIFADAISFLVSKHVILPPHEGRPAARVVKARWRRPSHVSRPVTCSAATPARRSAHHLNTKPPHSRKRRKKTLTVAAYALYKTLNPRL